MKRRIILIAVIAVVLLGLVGGIVWVVRRGGDSDLARANVAIKAGRFEKAANLAKRYTAEYPDDWRGYYAQARALAGAGRYEGARQPLKEATGRFPDKTAISLALAETYALPARNVLRSALAKKDGALFRKAIAAFEQAQRVLDSARGWLDPEKVDEAQDHVLLLEQAGLNRMRTAMAYVMWRNWLLDTAGVARASRQVDLADMLEKAGQATSALVASHRAAAEAIDTLLAVVRIDASRDTAVRPLVQLAMDRKDTNPHEDLRRVMGAFPDDVRKVIATPEAELRWVLTQLAGEGSDTDPLSDDSLAKIISELSAEDRKALAGTHGDVYKLLAALSPEDRKTVLASHETCNKSMAVLRALGEVRAILDGLSDKDCRAVADSPEGLRGILGDLDGASRQVITGSLNRYHRIVASWRSVDELRSVLARAEDPAPIATTNLLIADLSALKDRVDTQTYLTKSAEVARKLDEILLRHPDVVEVGLARAELALGNNDLAMARKCCDLLRGTNSRNRGIRLLHARLLELEGDPKRAMGELFSLTASFPRWVPGHLAFARVSHRMADLGHMEQAMRTVTRLAPGHPAASRFMAEYLYARGFYAEAFEDAQAYHEAHPEDPSAVRLFAKTAAQANAADEARKVLAAAESDYSSRLDMLIAVAIGYDAIGDKSEAMRVAGRIADAKAGSPRERRAVARAMVLIGKSKQAETLLADELKRDPGQHELAFELAELHARTGRVVPALEYYRSAVKLRPYEERYRLALARGLLDNGDLAECEQALRQVSEDNMEGNLLRLQIKLLRGQSVDTQEMIRRVQKAGRSGLPLAMSYLNHGRPNECIRVCEAELSKRPDNVNARSLLGEAHLVLGQTDKTIEQWTKVLESSPDRLGLYLRLAAVLNMRKAPEQVAYYLSHIPIARSSLVDMAMGWLWARRGDSAKAAMLYGRVVNQGNVSKDIRGRAALLGARHLALAGYRPKAIENLDKLAAVEGWKSRALLGKAQVLAVMGRADQVEEILQALTMRAAAEQDLPILYGTVALYVRTRKTDAALANCKEIQRITPRSAEAHGLTGRVFAAAGQLDKAIASYRKAVEVQPGNIRARLVLARTLDAVEGPVAGLAVLEDMERMGGRGKAVSMLERGMMFVRWGLHAEAAKCFEQLKVGGQGRNPAIQLVLGRAFLMSGKPRRAASVLAKIPEHADQYVAARSLLAELTEDTAERLKILKALSQTHRGSRSAPIQEMSALMRAERSEEAIKLFEKTFLDEHGSGPVPTSASQLALGAMLQAGDIRDAADLSLRMYEETKQGGWRATAIFLTVADRPAVAVGLLDQVKRSKMLEALLGVVVAGRQGDTKAARQWLVRLDEVDRRLRAAGAGHGVPAEYKLLSALAAGEVDHARKLLAALKGSDIIVREAAGELISSSARAAAAVEAAVILKASLAMASGMPQLGRTWAMQTLKARPTCQWAAAIAFRQTRAPAVFERILQTLKPADCPVALMIRAGLLSSRHQHAEAGAIYARLAAQNPDDSELAMSHAEAVEAAGQLPQAVQLYRKIWKATKNPRAANNLAYLIPHVHGDDKAKLTEAYDLARIAQKSFPRAAAVRDTVGWVAHKLGKHDEAVRNLRLAVRTLPNEPTVHYHLGMAEATAGRKKTARWHLSAAADIGQTMKENKLYIEPQTAKAIQLAKVALERLP